MKLESGTAPRMAVFGDVWLESNEPEERAHRLAFYAVDGAVQYIDPQLEPGERVVLNPNDLLTEGTKVRVQTPSPPKP